MTKHWQNTNKYNCGLQNVVVQSIQKTEIEVVFVKADVCQTNEGENSEQRECFKTETFHSFISAFLLNWANDFTAVSAHFQANKVANWRLFLMYCHIFHGPIREFNLAMIMTFRIKQTEGTEKLDINVNESLQVSHLLLDSSIFNYRYSWLGINVYPLWPKFTKQLDGGVKPCFSTGDVLNCCSLAHNTTQHNTFDGRFMANSAGLCSSRYSPGNVICGGKHRLLCQRFLNLNW